jgi:ribosome production factor 1
MDEDEESDEEEEEPKAGPSGSKAQAEEDDEDDEDMEDEGEGEGEDAEEETEEKQKAPEPVHTAPPRILITTSPGPSKPTYHFCDDLKSIFPGGEFFKRPKGRGFELGRVARWGAKRGYSAVIVVNEDHKKPSELSMNAPQLTSDALTLINLPAGPTAYFKLSSVQLGSDIHGHGRATAHNRTSS